MGNKIVEGLSAITTSSRELLPDILFMSFRIVNACLIGNPNGNSDNWVLVDTGLENSGNFILESAKHRFGQNSRPRAIILTHGHFDHVGSVIELAETWDVPIYIHRLELPYITGKKDYPSADPTVDKGMVAKMSPSFPHTSIDVGLRAFELPDDGSIPGLKGWEWIHTPGHSEGHVSLFRESDRVLIAADAFSTTKQESLSAVITQDEKISGPPKYFTTDWDKARRSVERLMELKPFLVIPGHGQPMHGEELTEHLELLVDNFDEIAKPTQGQLS